MAARRVEGLQIERVADEILALKSGATESHALNQTAAIVFDLCDGAHSKSEMAAAIQHRTGLPADESVVDLALDGLVEAGLVMLDGSPTQAGITRRSLMRRLSLSAAAAALLPVVETILRTPVAEASLQEEPRWSQRPPGIITGPPPGSGGGRPPGVGKPPGSGRPPGV